MDSATFPTPRLRVGFPVRRRTSSVGLPRVTDPVVSIAANLESDQSHSNRRLNDQDVPPIESVNCKPDSDDSIDRILIKNEEMDLLQQAFKNLKSQEKEVLILAKYQNLTYKQVGSILNCAEGTVKAKVFRAVQSLKSNYNTLER